MQPVPTEWYQLGYWPLIGAALILLVPNAAALTGIYLQAAKQNRAQLCMKRIEQLSVQLSDFYDPLYAILSINHDCFARLGPATFPMDPILRESAGENWALVRDRVILPNNKEIATILRTRSHLIAWYDSMDEYLGLNAHINMYQVFVDSPTEHYRDFRFPQGIEAHVKTVRERVVAELRSLRGDPT